MNMTNRMTLAKAMVLILLFCLSWPTAVQAVIKELDLSPYTKTNYLLSKGRYKQVSEHWDKLSIMFLANRHGLDQQTMWQSAGLAAALASIAADKNNDPIAYQYWADSTRYLLTGGTNWQQVQAHLHQRLETANTQLSVVLQVNDVTGGLDESLEKELSVLQAWDEKLNFFAFTAPKLGLKKYVEPSQDAQPVTNVRQMNRTQSHSQGQNSGQKKKLSGIDTNFSQTQSFITAPTVTEIAGNETEDAAKSEQSQKMNADSSLDKDRNPDKAESIETKGAVINSSDSSLSSAAQGNVPVSTRPSPMARGNLSIIEEQKYESRQKRHSSRPVPLAEDVPNETSDGAKNNAKSSKSSKDKLSIQTEANEQSNTPLNNKPVSVSESSSESIDGAKSKPISSKDKGAIQTEVNGLSNTPLNNKPVNLSKSSSDPSKSASKNFSEGRYDSRSESNDGAKTKPTSSIDKGAIQKRKSMSGQTRR
ncbi:hypothetical protein [uncultured Shewanella sp.]|uniref:hypothetical protein n=1 Tax=uncultured Shewanella sp. TaxID=173975 RepID=UPI00262B285C|nr:hypothetical protein [uncultured Shewanella sp.]